MEVEDANPPCDAREWEITKDMESYLEQRERISVGSGERTEALLRSDHKMCIVTFAELVLEDGGYHWFLVAVMLWSKEVADAARFAHTGKE